MKKRIVTIGGGNGSVIVLRALKPFVSDIKIDAVVSVADSGGSSGRLRSEFKTLPPGDILRSIMALSKFDFDTLKEIFYTTRFSGEGFLKDHNVGNIFLGLGTHYTGSFDQSLRAFEEALQTVGSVHPASSELAHLVCELEDGTIIRTESNIDRPDKKHESTIKKIWIEPEVEVSDGARDVILNADIIILCAGSLYTSIIAGLLPKGTREAISESKAKIVSVFGNAYEINGEPGPQTFVDYYKVLESYLPRPVDTIFFNNHELTPEIKEKYKEKEWDKIEKDLRVVKDDRCVFCDYENDRGGLDSQLLSQKISSVILSSMYEKYFSNIPKKFNELFEDLENLWTPINRLPDFLYKNVRSQNDGVIKGDVMIEGNVFIGEGTIIEHGAVIKGPCIIGQNCEIRAHAYIRGNVVIGDNCVVGHTTEIKDSILLDDVRLDHFSYVGSSILGNNVHLGSGAKIANLRFDRKDIMVDGVSTERKKFGAVLGDDVQLGVNVCINPGTLIQMGAWIGTPHSLRGGIYTKEEIKKYNKEISS